MDKEKQQKEIDDENEILLSHIEEPIIFQTHKINLEVAELDRPITCQGFCDGGLTQYMVIIKGKYYCPSCALEQLYGIN